MAARCDNLRIGVSRGGLRAVLAGTVEQADATRGHGVAHGLDTRTIGD